MLRFEFFITSFNFASLSKIHHEFASVVDLQMVKYCETYLL